MVNPNIGIVSLFPLLAYDSTPSLLFAGADSRKPNHPGPAQGQSCQYYRAKARCEGPKYECFKTDGVL